MSLKSLHRSIGMPAHMPIPVPPSPCEGPNWMQVVYLTPFSHLLISSSTGAPSTPTIRSLFPYRPKRTPDQKKKRKKVKRKNRQNAQTITCSSNLPACPFHHHSLTSPPTSYPQHHNQPPIYLHSTSPFEFSPSTSSPPPTSPPTSTPAATSLPTSAPAPPPTFPPRPRPTTSLTSNSTTSTSTLITSLATLLYGGGGAGRQARERREKTLLFVLL